MNDQRMNSARSSAPLQCARRSRLPLAAVGAPDAKPTPKPTPIRMPYTPDAVTHHSVTIDGKSVDYTARAGTIELRNSEDQPTARMSYVAYTVGNDPHRPVTFLYNGGPGSSSMWLLMGSVGPVHVVTPGDRLAGAPPFRGSRITTRSSTNRSGLRRYAEYRIRPHHGVR